MITQAELQKQIRDFAATISSQPIGLVLYRPESWALPTRCLQNVLEKIERNAGSCQFGWMFQHRFVVNIPGPGYLIAVNHAIWRAPGGQLIDVTPFHSEKKHQPLSLSNDVLFLVDDCATPLQTESIVSPLPSRFMALGPEKQLVDYVQHLNFKEVEAVRQLLNG